MTNEDITKWSKRMAVIARKGGVGSLQERITQGDKLRDRRG
jgi:hypothetical protein